jgi:pantetheine-phosphate adenylyltransferase
MSARSKGRIGLYPGTFDPVTLGHMDIITRAVKLVDHLVIGVADNPAKAPLFTIAERIKLLRHETEAIAGDGRATISVETISSLLVHHAQKIGATVIIRGLRAVSDFEYEFQMVGMNQRLAPDIETVFLMADPRHQAIASRLVKEIAALGGDVSPFTSPHVAKALRQRFGKSKA